MGKPSRTGALFGEIQESIKLEDVGSLEDEIKEVVRDNIKICHLTGGRKRRTQ